MQKKSFLIDSREQLIALSQQLADHIDNDYLQQSEPVVITLLGAENAGKSLVPSAMRTQKLGTAIIEPGVMTEHFWDAQTASGSYLKAYYRNYNFNSHEPDQKGLVLVRNPLAKLDLKNKGDLVFIQNPPPFYNNMSDIRINVLPLEEGGQYASWERMITVTVLNESLLNDPLFQPFWERLDTDLIRKLADAVPDGYLKDPDVTYRAINYGHEEQPELIG